MIKNFILLLLIFTLFGCHWTTTPPRDDLVVCLNFDDNCLSTFSNALPLMNEYGLRGTVFVNSGRVGTPGRMSWTQLDTLKQVYGWEIGGHTLYHEYLSELTYQQAEYTISADKDSLVLHGYNPKSFATTFGFCPVEYYSLINHYYKNIRTCFNLSMHCPLDRTLIGSFGVTSQMSAQDILNRVRQGILDQENLVVLLFHEVSYSNADYFDNLNPDVFAEVIQGLHRMGVKVLPLDEALDYLSD